MRYDNLTKDILSILHTFNDKLVLSLYNKNGNKIVPQDKEDEIKIININNFPMVIELADDDNSIVTIWKDNKSFTEEFIKCIKRIRERTNMNGVDLDIKEFFENDKLKVFKYIQASMQKRKKMEESLIKEFNKFNNRILKTKRTTDMFLSETLLSKNLLEFITCLKSEIKALPTFNFNDRVIINQLFECKCLNDYSNVLANVDAKQKKKLLNKSNILEALINFERSKYLNNTLSIAEGKTIYISENVKIYEASSRLSNSDKAYNHLLSLLSGVTTEPQLNLIIRKNKLEETYGVSKEDLINKWLSNVEPNVDKTVFIAENTTNEKISIDKNYAFGLGIIGNYLSESFDLESSTGKALLNTLNRIYVLKEFIESNRYNPKVCYDLDKFLKLLKESFRVIKEANDSKDYSGLFIESDIDYKDELEKLEEQYGLKSEALKYLAEKNVIKANSLLDINKRFIANDFSILSEALVHIVNTKKAKRLSNAIISEGLFFKSSDKIKEVTKENFKDSLRTIRKMLETFNQDVSGTLQTYFFLKENINKKVTEKDVQFLNTLLKYVV